MRQMIRGTAIAPKLQHHACHKSGRQRPHVPMPLNPPCRLHPTNTALCPCLLKAYIDERPKVCEPCTEKNTIKGTSTATSSARTPALHSIAANGAWCTYQCTQKGCTTNSTVSKRRHMHNLQAHKANPAQARTPPFAMLTLPLPVAQSTTASTAHEFPMLWLAICPPHASPFHFNQAS